MAYSEYNFHRNRVTTNYGTEAKAVADIIEANVPGITLDTITTETASVYDATYTLDGMSNVKMRMYNSSYSFHIAVGADLTVSEAYNDVSRSMNGTSGAAYRFLWTSGMVMNSLGGGYWGRLTSIVDGSIIEVYGSSTFYYVALPNGEYASCTISAPTISETQRSLLPSGTWFVAEGIYATNHNDLQKAPYLLNGNGPYYIASPELGAYQYTAVISNGTDRFVIALSNGNGGTAFGWRI